MGSAESDACPAEELLLAFAEGVAPAAQLPALHVHLDDCASCRAIVVDLSHADLAHADLAHADLSHTALTHTAPAGESAPLELATTAAQLGPAGKPQSATSATDWNVPIELDEYQLIRQLGQGAMGTVYLAHDTVLDREVAIKWIAMIEPSAEARSRFLLEARAIARLQHPNVASVYRVGQIDGRPYLVCEYVRGQSLDRLPKPVGWECLLPLAIGLTRGLEAAHRRGVLHRDLKPANAILAEDGEVKLLDFGLAKLLPRPVGSTAQTDFVRALEPPWATPGESEVLGDSGVVGTPLYMAPELWRGEAATPRADIYALGALLYELATGQPPVQAQSLEELRQEVFKEVQPAAALAPTLDPQFAALIDRCLSREPAQRFGSADELAQALALLPPGELAPLPGGNPYRGLAAFDAEHRALFYGRSSEIRAVLELLRREPLVVVSGDSGVGKSSLCRAGVLPLCEEGGLAGGRAWTTVTLVPGQHPLGGLGAALAIALQTTPEEVLARLRTPTQLAKELSEHQAGRLGLCLFVDQLEELVSTSDPDEAAAFTQTLRALADGARGVRILAALRGDFLARVAALPGLGELVRGLYLLRPLSAAGLREVIVNPARVRGVTFESEALVTELVHATLNAEGGLPLLSFALAELWEARAEPRRTIPATALHTIGGVEGALARHADALLRRLPVAERTATRRLLGKLVTPEGLRVRRSETDLCPPEVPAARVALESLLRGRLLVARVIDGASVYEIAHESLVSGWGTLRTWLAESREARALQQRLEQAAADWERLVESPDALWGGRQLAEVQPLLPALELAPREQRFLAVAQRQLRYRAWAQRGLVGVLGLVALWYIGASYRLSQEENLRVDQQLAETRKLLTQARASRGSAELLQRQAFTAFDHQQRDAGEKTWGEVLAARVATEKDYATATETLERELLRAPQQLPVRALLTTVLAERVVLAERRSQLAHRDELLRRLKVYDGEGTTYRHLTGPVPLELGSTPSGAQVALARYSADPSGRQVLSAPRELGVTPLLRSEIEPGSYVLILSATERTTVRFPILVGRGDAVRMHLDLPKAAAIPSGMVYIPGGRFLYGSATEDDVLLHHADPLHSTTTAAYLIAEKETTFADWIVFLRALDATERARRLPHSSAGFPSGGSSLSERPENTFTLTLQAGPQLYRARAGELVHYQGRDQRVTQDWLHFPVVGISYADAQVYTQWLAATGRVPGARLCSEPEWERAARGADPREYPHGEILARDDANYDETYGREPRALGPDEVGSYPGARSPFGLYDMAGNAEEWVRPPSPERCCTTRGGGYAARPTACAVNQRSEVAPGVRSASQGMRVCATYPAP